MTRHMDCARTILCRVAVQLALPPHAAEQRRDKSVFRLAMSGSNSSTLLTYIRVSRASRHISNGLAWTCSAVSDWRVLAFDMEQSHAP